MQKWIWLLPAIALWHITSAAQAQLWLRDAPRPGLPGRYDVHNPPLAPQPGVSPNLQRIYRDAWTATTWPNRGSQAFPFPMLELGPISPCRSGDPFDLQPSWDPRGSFGAPGMNLLEQHRSAVLNQKQIESPNPGTFGQPPPDLHTPVINPPPIAPVTLPGVAPIGHEPAAAPSWRLWAWVAAGIVVFGLLICLLRDYVERKKTDR
jgi:hypothetical protein